LDKKDATFFYNKHWPTRKEMPL